MHNIGKLIGKLQTFTRHGNSDCDDAYELRWKIFQAWSLLNDTEKKSVSTLVQDLYSITIDEMMGVG